MTSQMILYGATGYTGELIAERAVAEGLPPVLAGRSADKLAALAARLGLEWRAFGLADSEAIRHGIRGAGVVLNVAGPFSATATRVAEVCLASRCHYVDVTGEIDVFEDLAALDGRAKKAGVLLLPGAGFDVVPSDCLAACVAAVMPSAVRLRLSIGALGGASRGTMKTAVEGLGHGVRVRRDGRLVELPAAPKGEADFGSGPRLTLGVSWGDVSTAWWSTGIADVDVHFEATPALARIAALPGPMRRVLATRPVQALLKRAVDRMPAGPTAQERASGRPVIVAEAWDGTGARAMVRQSTPEGYALTVETALEIARRAWTGAGPAGFHTPSSAFGHEFVLGFAGVEREKPVVTRDRM